MKDQKDSCCVSTVSESLACCGPETAEPDSCATSLAAPASAQDSGCCGASVPEKAEAGGCCGAGTQATPRSALANSLKPLLSAWSLILAIPLLVALLVPADLAQVVRIASSALLGTAPYIVFAVLLIAYLKASGAENQVARAFVGREKRMIVLAALFGGLAPFCSCEVIPFIAGLLALGAPVSAVMAFWLSSPLIDPPSLMITAGALGWEFALGKAVSAVALGLLGGFGVRVFMNLAAFSYPQKGAQVPSCSTGGCAVDQPLSGRPQWKFWQHAEARRTFAREGRTNALFLFKWLALAYLLEALLILYIPAELIGGLVGGDGLGAVALGALVGMPAYLNSYAAPPLVAGLMEQGMSAGSAMAFMVAGAISSIPAMTAVWSLVRRPVFAAYLGFGLGGAILFGALFGSLLSSF